MRAAAAACLASGTAALAPVHAATVDFDLPLYVHDKTIDGVDDWTRSSQLGGLPENFRTHAENGTLGGNKWMRVWSDGQNTLFRPFPAATGYLDVSWRWRANDTRAEVCLGVSSTNDNARAATRGHVCFHAQGRIAAVDLTAIKEVNSTSTWTPNTVYFMRMRYDQAGSSYSVYMGTDSLRADEQLIVGPLTMPGLATSGFSRLVVRTEGGIGTADVDDIAWGTVAVWRGTVDSLASNAKNWSTQSVPDSSVHAVLNALSERTLYLDKPSTVRAVTVEPGYNHGLNLGSMVLTTSGKADFTGLKAPAASTTGAVRLTSSRGQSLVSPLSVAGPSVLHDGTGVLRLDGRAWFGKTLTQTAGTLDFNKNDVILQGYLVIQNGGPASLRNLDGRNISVAKSARLEGTSATVLLPLRGATAPWNISVTDTLGARFAEIQSSTAALAKGYAIQSQDKGSNSNWAFVTGPSILANPSPVSVLVGQPASLKVSASGGGLPPTFQWLLAGQPLAGQTDSILSRPKAALADNGSYSCQVSTAAGTVTSAPAALTVTFPVPAAQPSASAGSYNFPDSVLVTVSSQVAGASLLVSRNGLPYGVLTGGLTIKETTSLKARAALGPDTSAESSFSYVKTALSKVEPPEITPEDMAFPDTLVISMEPVTPGSVIHYTIDQTIPSTAKPRYTGPFVIRATTIVKAIAVKDGMEPSDAHQHVYTRINTQTLEHPTATPPGGSFGDTVMVSLAAPASAPNADVYFRVNGGPLSLYRGPFILNESSTVKAVAILGPAKSDTATWNFTRRLEAPTASPKGRKFPDSLFVSLVHKTAGATIHYTVDGSAPGATSKAYTGPILLDSTVTLKAVTVKAGMATSDIMVETYELVPDSLKASPAGGDFAEGIFIQLQSTSARATIFYTLDGSEPGTGNPSNRQYTGGIRLDTNAVLKAAAAAGQGAGLRWGKPITEQYTFITAGVRSVGPGQTIFISSRYSISNPFPGAPSILMEVIKADSLKALKGFRDVQFGIKVNLPPESNVFPPVRFAAPEGELRALYDMTPNGAMHWISDADTVELPGVGTYFMGVDTMPPSITFSGENMVGDATKLIFSIQDNVSSMVLDLERSDDPKQNEAGKNLSNPDLVSLTLQSSSAWSPLWVKLQVHDRRNTRSFPADPTAEYHVARKATTSLRSPAVFRVGSKADQPWDMVSLPLEIEGGLTLGGLKAANPVKGLEARVWDEVQNKFRAMRDNEALPPGQALWMGSPSSLSALSLPPFQTVPRKGEETYKVKLKKGWNQVANPSLRPLIWPFSRKGSDYIGSQIKGLHGYDASLGGDGFFHADTLLPWKGYYVLHKGTKDTTIVLRTSPVPAPPAKRGPAAARAGGPPSFPSLGLALGRLPAIRLGALPQAEDGLGIEDEPQPPAPSGRGPGIWSARGRARLATDFVRWTDGASLSWRVVASSTGYATVADKGPSGDPAARVEGVELPEGYAAWAVSRARGLRFRLAEGSAIPLPSAGDDSLDVHAGPAAALDARLAGIPARVDAFRFEALARPGGYSLRLALPHAARIRFSLWSVDGRALDAGDLQLAAGFYDLSRAGSLPAGLAVLRAEWSGSSGLSGNRASGRLTRKLTLP